MDTGELIAAVFIFAIAGVLLILGIRHFMEKGLLMNNVWLYASTEERKIMDKKPYYRQSAIVLFLLSAVFIIVGLSLVFQNDRIVLLEIPLIGTTIIYAIVSSVQINKK